MQKKLIWILTILSALITILLAAGEQPWPLIIAYWLVLTVKNARETLRPTRMSVAKVVEEDEKDAAQRNVETR